MCVCVCVISCVSCLSVRPPIWAGPDRTGFVVCLSVCHVHPSVSLIRVCVCVCVCVMFVHPSTHLGRTGPDWFCGLSVCVSCPSVCLSDMCVCVCVMLCVSCLSVHPPIWAGPDRTVFFGLSDCCVCAMCNDNILLCFHLYFMCLCHLKFSEAHHLFRSQL